MLEQDWILTVFLTVLKNINRYIFSYINKLFVIFKTGHRYHFKISIINQCLILPIRVLVCDVEIDRVMIKACFYRLFVLECRIIFSILHQFCIILDQVKLKLTEILVFLAKVYIGLWTVSTFRVLIRSISGP